MKTWGDARAAGNCTLQKLAKFIAKSLYSQVCKPINTQYISLLAVTIWTRPIIILWKVVGNKVVNKWQLNTKVYCVFGVICSFALSNQMPTGCTKCSFAFVSLAILLLCYRTLLLERFQILMFLNSDRGWDYIAYL